MANEYEPTIIDQIDEVTGSPGGTEAISDSDVALSITSSTPKERLTREERLARDSTSRILPTETYETD